MNVTFKKSPNAVNIIFYKNVIIYPRSLVIFSINEGSGSSVINNATSFECKLEVQGKIMNFKINIGSPIITISEKCYKSTILI